MSNHHHRCVCTPVHRIAAWLQVFALLVCPLAVHAEPTDPSVVGGSATVSNPDPTTTLIQQFSDRAIINWQGFSIDVNELVRFDQPSAAAIALNRVTGQDPSTILGRLAANGRVFLVNPNGVVFGPGARVDVAGMLATTFDIKDTDFMAGKMEFAQDPAARLGAIVNKGEIRVSDEGFVFLVGPAVANEGLIVAKLGKVVLAAGQKLVLDFNGDGLVNYSIEGEVLQRVLGPDGVPLASAVSNSGEIQADGGSVVMHARGPGDVFSSVVNNSGIIRARSLRRSAGVVRLEASSPVENTAQIGAENNLGQVPNALGTVIHSGLIDVSPWEADALPGAVTLTGERVGVSGDILAPGGSVLLRSTLETIVTRASLIDVSATPDAAAGTAVVWSDRDTRFYGTILGRGAEGHPDGGTAEVSGYENLGFDGIVDLEPTPGGVAGTLLLDPYSVVIGALGTDNAQITADAQILFADGGAFAVFFISAAAVAGLTANINIQATYDVVFMAPLSLTNLGLFETLSVNAGHSITVGATITAAGGNVDLIAGLLDPTGVLTVNAAITTTVFGRIYLENDLGVGGILINAPLNADAVIGSVYLVAGAGPITQTAGGDITTFFLGLRAFDDVSLDGNHLFTLSAGAVTGAGNSLSIRVLGAGLVTVGSVGAQGSFPATSGFSTSDGPISLDAAGSGSVIVGQALNAGTSTVDLRGTYTMNIVGLSYPDKVLAHLG